MYCRLASPASGLPGMPAGEVVEYTELSLTTLVVSRSVAVLLTEKSNPCDRSMILSGRLQFLTWASRFRVLFLALTPIFPFEWFLPGSSCSGQLAPFSPSPRRLPWISFMLSLAAASSFLLLSSGLFALHYF